jgi:DNA-binding Lrp family transcriptional regulator
MPDPDRTSMDEVDRIIIGILAANPRIPYTKIYYNVK